MITIHKEYNMSFLWGILYMSLPLILVTAVAIAFIDHDNTKNDLISFILFWAYILFALLVGIFISENYIKIFAYQ